MITKKAYEFKQFGDYLIDLKTGETWASQRGLARLFANTARSTLQYYLTGQGIEGISVQVPTDKGLRAAKVYNEETIALCIRKFGTPEQNKSMDLISVRVLIHKAAGYQVTSTALSTTEQTLQLVLANQEKMLKELAEIRGDAIEHQSMKPAFDLHKKVPDTMKAIAGKIADGVGNWNILRVLGGEGWQKLGNKRAKTGKDIKAVWCQTTGSNPPRSPRGLLYPESFLPVIEDQININS